MASNNNVSIQSFDGRLFVSWRTAPTHFASEETKLQIVSSTDNGTSWDYEATFAMGTDLREPLLYQLNGRLFFTFFQAGVNMLSFEPKDMWRSERKGQGDWSKAVKWGEPKEVPWEVLAHNGKLYLTTYLGTHYELAEETAIDVRFFESQDGENWTPVNGDNPAVYTGGASEAAFHFDDGGQLWAVLRNEDGDSTGFGSLLCRAPADNLGAWDCPTQSDPERYDSPRMLRHNGELFVVARRDIGGPFGAVVEGGNAGEQKRKRLLAYSGRPKRTALYKINRSEVRVEHLMDLPSNGDTSFPSIVQTSEHAFLIANYSSPLDDLELKWLDAQLSEKGTQLYLIDLNFEPIAN